MTNKIGGIVQKPDYNRIAELERELGIGVSRYQATSAGSERVGKVFSDDRDYIIPDELPYVPRLGESTSSYRWITNVSKDAKLPKSYASGKYCIGTPKLEERWSTDTRSSVRSTSYGVYEIVSGARRTRIL